MKAWAHKARRLAGTLWTRICPSNFLGFRSIQVNRAAGLTPIASRQTQAEIGRYGSRGAFMKDKGESTASKWKERKAMGKRDSLYGLGVLGAAVYFIQSAQGFWMAAL